MQDKMSKISQSKKRTPRGMDEEIESDEENEQLVINERLAPEDTYNPTIQYFNQVVTHKVVNPD